jgi:hypothetical protein
MATTPASTGGGYDAVTSTLDRYPRESGLGDACT